MRVGPFAFRYKGKGATPCHYIDTTRKAIDCAITLPLRVLTQYRRVTDGRTDGQTGRQTELLWLVQRLQCEHCIALRRAVKMRPPT